MGDVLSDSSMNCSKVLTSQAPNESVAEADDLDRDDA